jgi:hypothetical protein
MTKVNAGKSLSTRKIIFAIRELTLVRSALNAGRVGKPSSRVAVSSPQALERPPMEEALKGSGLQDLESHLISISWRPRVHVQCAECASGYPYLSPGKSTHQTYACSRSFSACDNMETPLGSAPKSGVITAVCGTAWDTKNIHQKGHGW